MVGIVGGVSDEDNETHDLNTYRPRLPRSINQPMYRSVKQLINESLSESINQLLRPLSPRVGRRTARKLKARRRDGRILDGSYRL